MQIVKVFGRKDDIKPIEMLKRKEVLYGLGLDDRRHIMVKVKCLSSGLFDHLFDIPNIRNPMINPRLCGSVY
jgi:hypothetical protein